MTVTEQMPVSQVDTLEFHRSYLSGETSPLEGTIKDYGVVYVTSITRDGCSGCAEQKPLFHEFAEKMNRKHPGQVRFTNIHIRYQEEDQKESWTAKKLLGHAAYPTYTVHLRSHVGPLEVYRAVYPSMDELEKQTTEALELAEHYKREADKAAPRK